MKKILGLLLIALSPFAQGAPSSDKAGVCYLFSHGKLNKTSTCVVSSGTGAGGFYETLQIGKKRYVSETSTCYNQANDEYDECGTVLNGKVAENYFRNSFYDEITDTSLIDDSSISCTRTKDRKIDVCSKQ